jgi:MFS family permease
MDANLIGGIVAGLLTLMVFSYLLGANPLWRIAQSLLVGVSVGYVSLVVLTQVIAPQVGRIIQPPEGTLEADRWLAIVPVALGLLLLLRIAVPGAWPASLGLNLVVVVGAALALGGALAGILVPQTLDTMRLLYFADDPASIAALVGNIVLVLGVICALVYFAFGARANGERPRVVREVSAVGRFFLVLAFGAILGSLATTFYAALIDRLAFLVGLVEELAGF